MPSGKLCSAMPKAVMIPLAITFCVAARFKFCTGQAYNQGFRSEKSSSVLFGHIRTSKINPSNIFATIELEPHAGVSAPPG
eukprot:2104454-Pyramimonas_sp.AAC.1